MSGWLSFSPLTATWPSVDLFTLRSTGIRLHLHLSVDLFTLHSTGKTPPPSLAAPHLWNKLPSSLRVPCQSATSEYNTLLHCQAPTLLLNRWLACHTGSSILVLKLTFSPDPFPRNLPLSLTDLFHDFYPARVRKFLALKILVSAAD